MASHAGAGRAGVSEPEPPPLPEAGGADGGVYVRVGSTNRRADRELVEELRRFARGEAFDEQPMRGLDSEALDFRAASESFAPVRRLGRADLETLRLVTADQGRKVPTVGGILLFGLDRDHEPDRERDGAARGENAARDPMAHERSEMALVRVSALSDGAAFRRVKHYRHLPLLKQALQHTLSLTNSAAA